MSRILFLFLLSAIRLSAQQETGEEAATAQETGEAAAIAAETTKESNWQNWVFAGSALVTATIGVVIISVSSGTTSH
ncbi:MAG: hypothetical protein FJZ64_02605 [Chlamydiae bacterium]|nr:hypothetical protein [Chlamydiota bacterium]